MSDSDLIREPIRVLLLADGFDRIERRVIGALSRRGVEYKVLLNVEGHDADTEYFRENGIAFEHLLCRNRIDLKAIRRIRRELAAAPFDIMHGYINRPLSCGMWAAWGYDDLKRIGYRGTAGNVKWHDPASRMTYLHPRMDRIICVSAAVQRSLLDLGLPEKRLPVIHKGHDPSWYTPAERSRLREFGVPDDAFVVCCIANVRPGKGVDVLVRAWEHIPRDREIHLLLIGEVRERDVRDLLESSPQRERLHAIGFHPDAASIQGACDLAAMVSVVREGLPRAILEGQAQGVPGLVTRVGGMPEIVTDGVNGFVVEPRDPKAISDAIVKAYDDPAELAAMGRRARECCERDFAFQATVDKTLAVYRELAAERLRGE